MDWNQRQNWCRKIRYRFQFHSHRNHMASSRPKALKLRINGTNEERKKASKRNADKEKWRDEWQPKDATIKLNCLGQRRTNFKRLYLLLTQFQSIFHSRQFRFLCKKFSFWFCFSSSFFAIHYDETTSNGKEWKNNRKATKKICIARSFHRHSFWAASTYTLIKPIKRKL